MTEYFCGVRYTQMSDVWNVFSFWSLSVTSNEMLKAGTWNLVWRKILNISYIYHHSLYLGHLPFWYHWPYSLLIGEMHFMCVWENQIYDEVPVTHLRPWCGVIRVLCTYLTFVSTREIPSLLYGSLCTLLFSISLDYKLISVFIP
jgi:hypothetical protein